MRGTRGEAGAVVIGVVLLAGMAGVLAWSRSGVAYPYDGFGVTRLLDRLVADLNTRDEPSIATLIAGEGSAVNGAPSGSATDAARSWTSQYGGLGLRGAGYQWRRDLAEGMLTEVEITATTAAGAPVSVWLTVTGFAPDDSHSSDVAARISGPRQDTRIGASAPAPIPASDGDGQVAGVWIGALGGTGLVVLVVGSASRTARRARLVRARDRLDRL